MKLSQYTVIPVFLIIAASALIWQDYLFWKTVSEGELTTYHWIGFGVSSALVVAGTTFAIIKIKNEFPRQPIPVSVIKLHLLNMVISICLIVVGAFVVFGYVSNSPIVIGIGFFMLFFGVMYPPVPINKLRKLLAGKNQKNEEQITK